MLTSDRNEQIVEAWKLGSSASMIAREYGISKERVKQLVSDLPPRRLLPKRKKLSELPVLSLTHRQIGIALISWRTEKQLNAKSAASILGVTVERLAAVERGVYDITLLDLRRFAAVVGSHLLSLVAKEPS